MSAPAHIPDIAHQAATALAEAASSPSRVVLFGSHARGSAHPDSDLDFLAIEDEVENVYLRPRDFAAPCVDSESQSTSWS